MSCDWLFHICQLAFLAPILFQLHNFHLKWDCLNRFWTFSSAVRCSDGPDTCWICYRPHPELPSQLRDVHVACATYSRCHNLWFLWYVAKQQIEHRSWWERQGGGKNIYSLQVKMMTGIFIIVNRLEMWHCFDPKKRLAQFELVATDSNSQHCNKKYCYKLIQIQWKLNLSATFINKIPTQFHNDSWSWLGHYKRS